MTNQSQNQNSLVRRGASSSRNNASRGTKLSLGSMNPLSLASISLAASLLLVVPLCHSAPVVLQQATADQRQLLSQMDAACSSFFSADVKFALSEVSDIFGELCVLMLVQKSKVTLFFLCEAKIKDVFFLFFRSLENGEITNRVLYSLSCIWFLICIPEAREDCQCELNFRDLLESRAEATFSIGLGTEEEI
nr:neuromedin-U isoform X1 [Nerophis lumbriciformis]XP_061834580.1 neuromedin-U isoform X1 [Nerophis lumbriciformis]